MKRKQFFMGFMLALFSLTFVFTGCKDDDPEDLMLSTLVSGTIDLNGATSPSNVPVNPTIVAAFNVDIDPATAVAANITLTQDYDDTNIPVTITVAGKNITIVPNDPLASGTLYELVLGAGLASTDGKFLTPVTRNFTTEGAFAPAGVIAHWTFEDNANDVVGTFDPPASGIKDVTYVNSRKTAAGKAASFNGTSTIIEVPNGHLLMNTDNFTLSFWVRAETQDKGHFVMGLAGWNGLQFEIFPGMGGCKLAAQYEFADGTTGSEDLWFPANGDLGWQGWTFCADLTSSGGLPAKLENKWAHIVNVYNAATREGKMYINGELMKAQDFDLWPDGEIKRTVKGLKYNGNPTGNSLAFGFIQGSQNRTIGDGWADPGVPENNHFKGQLDDIRFFHKAITAEEVQMMYNSEKP